MKNWIASMCDEPVYCFNNCHTEDRGKVSDPYFAKRSYWRNVRHNPTLQKHFVPLSKFYPGAVGVDECRQKYKKYLMYSYERQDLKTLVDGNYVKNHDVVVGKSKNTYRVLLIRDVFNWLASALLVRQSAIGTKLAALSLHPKYSQEPWIEDASIIPWRGHRAIVKWDIMGIWKGFAEEYLGKTNYLPNKVCISFNKWFVDEDYRKQIATSLDLPYSDETFHIAGSKSSTVGAKHRRDASKLSSLTSWRALKGNRVFEELLDLVPGVEELSNEIFGEIT